MDKTEPKHWFWLAGFAAVLALVSLLATWAGLAGSWVGDDWHMVGSYLYGDWAELGAVFQRNAGYYLFTDDKVGPYRPVTMLTLLGTHLLVPRPWLHHTVSWLLHGATTLLLFAALSRQLVGVGKGSEREADVASALAAAIFFLHPVSVEAYVWINGRSDLLAGFWLAALVVLLSRSSDASGRGVSVLVVGLVTFLGAGSKLPFVIAASAAWLAWAVRERSEHRLAYGGAIAVALGLHVVLRSVFAPFAGSLGTSDNVLFDGQVWLALPKLFSTGAVAVTSFRAEAMQSLSWVLFGPWSWFDWLGLAVILFVAFALVRARDLPSLIYFGGALLTLVPVVVVSRSFWMGFDRYLYMPGILLTLCGAPYLMRALFGWGRRGRTLTLGACAVFLALGAVQTSRASSAYADQEAYEAALRRDHADDPTIHYYFARAADRLGDQEALRARLAGMPPPPWPNTIIAPTYELAAKAVDETTARQAIDALVISSHGGQRCTEIRSRLETWRERAPNESFSAALANALEQVRCDP